MILPRTYYTQVKTAYIQDYARSIKNEALQTAELGRKWFDSDTFQLETSGGGAYHAYERTNEEYSEANGKFVLDLNMTWNIINSLKLFQKYNHVGNTEKYHVIWNGGIENNIVRDIVLRLEYRFDRDTEVNLTDKAYSDQVLLTSMQYKF